MAVIRVEKDKNYTCMGNYHLRDMRLSNKAIGLMCKMLSLPEDWDYSVRGLAQICKDGRDSILGQLRELEKCGYLIRERNRQANGQVAETVYTLIEKPCTENPTTGNPTQGNPTQGNPPQLNTKEINKEELNKEVVEGTTTTTTIFNIDQDVLSCYQDNIQPVTKPLELEMLADDIEHFGADKCIEAIKRAVIRNKRSLGYVESILRDWEVNGYDTEEGKKKSEPSQSQRPIVKNGLPDMTDEEKERLRREMYGES